MQVNKFGATALIVLFSIAGYTKELKLKVGLVDLKTTENSFRLKSQGRDDLSEFFEHEYFVVQYQNTISAEDQKFLQDTGIQVIRYLPDDAYLIRANQSQLLRLGRKNAVYEVSIYQPAWKLSPEFSSLSVFDSAISEIINLRLLPGSQLESILNLVRAKNTIEILFSNESELILKAKRSDVLFLSEIEGVEWVQKQPEIENFDFKEFNSEAEQSKNRTLTGYESGTKLMNFESAWTSGLLGQNQIVAMADTGLDTGRLGQLHPDLETVLSGHALGLFSNSWADAQGHGTHVAGSVIGSGRASNGAIRGGASVSKFIAISIWSDLFGNISIPSNFENVFKVPYSEGARIHTNSWGSSAGLGGYDSFASRTDQVMWDNPDLLILFAAGNNGQDLNKDGIIDVGSISSPGTAKNVVTVGASENLLLAGGRQVPHIQLKNGAQKWGAEPIASDLLSNNAEGIAAFSSRGPTNDNRIKPDIVAPGTNIVSVRSKDPRATTLWGEFDQNYVYAGGTSMATPLTAGAAAITRELLQTKFNQANPSGALVKSALLHSAHNLSPGQYGTGQFLEIPKTVPNNQQGYGRVDLTNLINLNVILIVDEKVGVRVGQEKLYDLQIQPAEVGKSLLVTLAYTDFPGAAAAQVALVNDLDLELESTTRQLIFINDRLNNTEQLRLSLQQSGNYVLRVKGRNVPSGANGAQPFAILVSIQ